MLQDSRDKGSPEKARQSTSQQLLACLQSNQPVGIMFTTQATDLESHVWTAGRASAAIWILGTVTVTKFWNNCSKRNLVVL
mmetsp:Transcript_74038/g.176259  ORF Transcript_74038/g.176259 Transcript_74038/m.176259 type:complete len:81 (-) Transcript_74038:608-850(-)